MIRIFNIGLYFYLCIDVGCILWWEIPYISKLYLHTHHFILLQGVLNSAKLWDVTIKVWDRVQIQHSIVSDTFYHATKIAFVTKFKPSQFQNVEQVNEDETFNPLLLEDMKLSQPDAISHFDGRQKQNTVNPCISGSTQSCFGNYRKYFSHIDD